MNPAKEQFNKPFSVSSSVSPPGGFSAPWHWHENNEIYICETEKMNYLVGNTLYEIQKGDILLFNALDVHRALPPDTENYSRKIILFQDSFLESWNTSDYDLFACFHFRKPEFRHYRHLDTNTFSQLLELFEKALEITKSNHPAAVLRQKMILSEILILLNEIYAVPVLKEEKLKDSSDEEYVQHVLTFIESNIGSEITLPRLSHEFGSSVNSMNSKFRKVTRMTIHQFIIQRRLQLACILLKQGKTVSESAYESGFGDLSHFIRCFKSNIGMTPRNYAQSKY